MPTETFRKISAQSFPALLKVLRNLRALGRVLLTKRSSGHEFVVKAGDNL